MSDASPFADLERRLERDPASIAFAQLAEDYRRAGRSDDAVRVCRAGLARYPAYTSARITLARALAALGRHDEAEAAFAEAAALELEGWLEAIGNDRVLRARARRPQPAHATA